MDRLVPWLRLQLTPGLGRSSLFQLINRFGSPQQALEAAAHGWPHLPGLRRGLASGIPRADDPCVSSACEKLHRADGWLCSFWDEGYPETLRDLPDPPALLYGRGRLPQGPALAVVGSRSPSRPGRSFTEELTRELSAAGLVIISGLARGIDSAAHRGALAGGGPTLAVLGCGIDRVYPQENTRLFESIIGQGAVLSEYPPGSAPHPGHFPGRNRIISGLSHAVLVVEAARESGSLITAEFALEQGREVMAVPGGVGLKTSQGPNQLIKEGAHPVTEAADVLTLFNLRAPRNESWKREKERREELPEAAAGILSRLGGEPLHCDELAGESGLTPMELSAILLHLELQGYVEKLPGGRYISRPLAP